MITCAIGERYRDLTLGLEAARIGHGAKRTRLVQGSFQLSGLERRYTLLPDAHENAAQKLGAQDIRVATPDADARDRRVDPED
jgi:hypothetical protein